LDSSGRNIGNEKVSNGRKGKETILVDRTREREGKVKGLYSEKEQKTLKKKKATVSQTSVASNGGEEGNGTRHELHG
jgi:hypothetical protein